MQSDYRRQILDVSWYITLEEGRFCPYLLTYLVTWNWGNRNLYLCHCWNAGFTLPGNAPFRPHYCCLSKECRDLHAKTQFALISWFLFLRCHDQCCVVNYYSCESLKSCAGLDMHVDDTLGVISLINWRCHHSDLLYWRNVWRVEKSASSFSHFQKSLLLDISCLCFRLMFRLFPSDRSPKYQRMRRWNGRWAPWARPPTTRVVRTTPPMLTALREEWVTRVMLRTQCHTTRNVWL